MDATTLDQVRRGRRGPVEGEELIGYDGDPARRPGVPMGARPSGATAAPLPPLAMQAGHEDRPRRASLDRPTPVFGTAQPLRGLSGVLRKAAYDIPEHHPRHWMVLMLADRVDVLENRVGSIVALPLTAAGLDGPARRARSNPAPFLAGALAGLLVTRLLVTRLLVD